MTMPRDMRFLPNGCSVGRGLLLGYLVFSAALVTALSDEIPFDGPLIGFVHDSSAHQIRPMRGVPGAALAGAPINLGFDVSKALIANQSRFALLPTSDGLLFVKALDSQPMSVLIKDGLREFDMGALSPSAKSAILYSRACSCLQIVTDLDKEPRLLKTIPAPQSAATVRAVAVADSGLAAVATTDRLSLYSVDDETPRAETPLEVSALTFSPDGGSLLVADTRHKVVSVISEPMGAAVQTEVTSERDGILNPVAVAFATANRVVVADADFGLYVVDRDAGHVASIECSCRPSELAPTAWADTFRLTGLDGGSVWIFRLDETGGSALFIPIDRSETAR